jgi:hypothetical protein
VGGGLDLWTVDAFCSCIILSMLMSDSYFGFELTAVNTMHVLTLPVL